MRITGIFLFIFLLLHQFSFAQDSVKVKNSIFPIAFYLPETGLGFGATGVLRTIPTDSVTRSNSFIYSISYTFRNQLLLFFPFELYGKSNHNRFRGELGFYMYFYNFYGIGPDSREDNLENYDVTFPRLDVTYAERILPNFFIGLGYQYDGFNITSIDADGFLNTAQPIGFDGGTRSNVQGLLFWDNRDNYLSASKGYFVQALVRQSVRFLGSDFDYTALDLDARGFFPINDRFVWANRILLSITSKGAPFFDLPFLSSATRARGFNDRRFMDYNMLTTQSEFRFPIKNRFKGVAFTSISWLSRDLGDIFSATPKFSYGIGLRYELDSFSKTRVRVDIASGGGDFNFYITTNEAF